MIDNKFLDLQQAIEKDSLIVFAGAGTSYNLGLPSWKKLVLNILQTIIEENNNEYINLFYLLEKDIVTPLEVLTHLEKAGFMDRAISLLKTFIKPDDIQDQNKLILHYKILKLTKKIITTNYDKIFELIMPIENTIIDNNNAFDMARVLRMNEFLFKIHGDINEPEKCILFKSQYKRAYKDSAFLTTLRTLFIEKTILFVGFSLTDPYIEQIIKAIDATYNSMNGKHYIITSDPGFIDGKYGGTVVSIPIDSHEELEHKLIELIDYKNGTTSHLLMKLRFNVPRSYSKLIGREKQLIEIMREIAKPAPVTVIYGPSGVGKTSLSLEIAYICLNRSTLKVTDVVVFKYVIWIPLHEVKDVRNIVQHICDEIGRQMGKANVQNTIDTKIKQNLVKEVLKTEEVLLVLDSYQVISTVEEQYEVDKFIAYLFEGLPQNTVKTEVLITTTTNRSYNFEYVVCELIGLDSEGARSYLQQEAKNQGIHLGKFGKQDILDKICVATEGNPNLMNIAIGYIKKQALSLIILDWPISDLKDLFKDPYIIPWNHISPQSQKLLFIILIFESKITIHRDVLHYISGFSNSTFTKSIDELYDWNLLIINIEDQNYSVHSSLISFLRLKQNNLSKELIKERFIAYYSNYIRNKIQRVEPNEIYWNTLVSEEMRHLDKHKYSIRLALQWAGQGNNFELYFLELTLLLVHYMDSRLYNLERVKTVRRAILICHKHQKHYEEALLSIDSLGWTYIEECRPKKARNTIERGIKIVENSSFLTLRQKDDLINLGYAWLARVYSELNLDDKAIKYLSNTTHYLHSSNSKSWIKSRIYQAHGDIYYKYSNYKTAHNFYLSAQAESDTYNGEGNNYRINPRIGLASIGIGTPESIKSAEEIFSNVLRNPTIYIAKLYCDYGLALARLKKAQLANNKRSYQDADSEIVELDHEVRGGKDTANNILLKFIDQLRKGIGPI
jgi:hypothetical protein